MHLNFKRRVSPIVPTSVCADHWCPDVEECITTESPEESARCEIVRTLVSLLFSCFAKPTREQCGVLAQQLILKHPFMKDDMGNG